MKCKVCEREEVRTRGMCRKCYQKWWREHREVGVREVEELVEAGKEEVVREVNEKLGEYGGWCRYEGGEVLVGWGE